MKNPFQRTSPEEKALKNFLTAYQEAKSFDVLPEGIWQQLVSATDMGATIGLEQAVGLPAVLAVIRFISHAAAMVPLNVIRDGNVRTRATDTWQWNLLHKRPGPPPQTPFNFKADLAANFVGRGNAYVRKLKPTTLAPRLTRDTPRVTELMSLHAGQIKPKLADNGSVVFVDSTGKVNVERGTDEIIQIRSFAVNKDGLTGLSPVTAARTFVSAGLKRHSFEERHLTNGISPSGAITFPKGMTPDKAAEWLDLIDQKHKGSMKAGKLLGLSDGATFQSLPISLADALFADMTRLTMEQSCAMFNVPLAIMTPQRRPVTDDEYRFFTTWCLGPVVTALAEAFEADDDLFAPNTPDDELSVSPDTDALLKLDALKKAQVQQEQIQGGLRLVDELRGDDGYAPLPPIPKDWTQRPGEVPQITPVGGAPNPKVNTDANEPGGEPTEDTTDG